MKQKNKKPAILKRLFKKQKTKPVNILAPFLPSVHGGTVLEVTDKTTLAQIPDSPTPDGIAADLKTIDTKLKKFIDASKSPEGAVVGDVYQDGTGSYYIKTPKSWTPVALPEATTKDITESNSQHWTACIVKAIKQEYPKDVLISLLPSISIVFGSIVTQHGLSSSTPPAFGHIKTILKSIEDDYPLTTSVTYECSYLIYPLLFVFKHLDAQAVSEGGLGISVLSALRTYFKEKTDNHLEYVAVGLGVDCWEEQLSQADMLVKIQKFYGFLALFLTKYLATVLPAILPSLIPTMAIPDITAIAEPVKKFKPSQDKKPALNEIMTLDIGSGASMDIVLSPSKADLKNKGFEQWCTVLTNSKPVGMKKSSDGIHWNFTVSHEVATWLFNMLKQAVALDGTPEPYGDSIGSFLEVVSHSIYYSMAEWGIDQTEITGTEGDYFLALSPLDVVSEEDALLVKEVILDAIIQSQRILFMQTWS